MSGSRRFVLVLVLAALVAAAGPAAAAPSVAAEAVPLSDESLFRSVEPQVVALAGGGFFSVWENQNQGLWGRAVAADGASAGAQRLLIANPTMPSNPGQGWWERNAQAAVAPLADGGFLLAWTRERTFLRLAVFQLTSTPLHRHVLVQRFAADGTPVGRERRISDSGRTLHSLPRIAALDADRFVVAWHREGNTGGVRARLVTADGQPIGRENAIAGRGALQAALAVNGAGDVLIAWSAPDAEEGGIFARLFDRGLAPRGEPFQVNTEEDLDQRMPRVAAGADDGFLVSWWSQHGAPGRVRDVAQLVGPNGSLAGAEKLIGDEWKTTNLAPNVVPLPGGGYLHAWVIWNRWYAIGIYAEVLDAAGEPVDVPVRVSDSRPQGQHQLGLAAAPDGTLFLAWEGFNGRERGIRGRALSAPASP